jgi:hypothetical protein
MPATTAAARRVAFQEAMRRHDEAAVAAGRDFITAEQVAEFQAARLESRKAQALLADINERGLQPICDELVAESGVDPEAQS